MKSTLQASEVCHRLLMKHRPDGIFVFDLKTSKILEVDDQFLKMLGYGKQDAVQIKLEDIVVLGDRAIRANISKMLEHRRGIFRNKAVQTS
jgi:PAS domain S-box-containing protein